MTFHEIPYQRPDTEALTRDFEQAIEALESAGDKAAQKRAIEQANEVKAHYETMSSLAFIRHSIDTRDDFYDAEKSFYDEFGPAFEQLNFRYYSALNTSRFREELEEEFGSELFTIAEYRIKSFDERIMDAMQEENKLGSEYSKLIASAVIDFDGKELNLSQLTPYMQNPDRAVRKAAARAHWGWLADHEADFDRIYDRLTHLRHDMATTMGLDRFTELGYRRMQRSDYTPEMVAVFRQEVLEHIVPITLTLRERQAKRIGLEQMTFYDVPFQFPSGNPTPKGTPEEIVANGQRMYDELSPETGEFFRFMRERKLMDLVAKAGKDSGGYCTYLQDHDAPFIFSNFNGTAHDVDVLTHEAGHAFQCYTSGRAFDIPEYTWSTSDAAEIHSMSMEFFAWPWMELFFQEDTAKYRFKHLDGALTFLPYGVAVDEFQHAVYERPDMTPTERRATWRSIETKYLPDTNYDGFDYLENGGRWHRQSHIFQMPFYYIDYTLAQVCALQYWTWMQRDREAAWESYMTLCRAGGSRSFLGLVDLAGLRNPFEPGVLTEVAAQATAWLDEVDDSAF